MADMVAAINIDFDAVYTMELSIRLYQQACRHFCGNPKVILVQGDSDTEVKDVIARLDQPALLWLDGHLSGGNTASADQDTPVMEQSFHISAAERRYHVIVIDDARLFGVDSAYPSVQEVDAYVRRFRDDVEITIADDSIRILPIWRRVS